MPSVKFRLAKLYDECHCDAEQTKHEFHYVSFDETFTRLKDVTDDVLDYINESHDIIKFMFGQTYVNAKDGKRFDSRKRITWSKTGIREKWVSLKDGGYDDIVVIGCLEEDLIREDACPPLRNTEKYTTALSERLIMHYAYQKPDERLYNDSYLPEKKLEEKSEGRLIYIALKYKSKTKKKVKSDSSSCSSSDTSKSSSSSSSSSSSDSDSDSDRKSSKSVQQSPRKSGIRPYLMEYRMIYRIQTYDDRTSKTHDGTTISGHFKSPRA